MNHVVFTLMLLFAAPATTAHAVPQRSIEENGKIVAVDLHQNGALITRTISIPDTDEEDVVVQVNLPRAVDTKSVYAFSPFNAQINSFRTKYWEEHGEVDEQVKELEASFLRLNEQLEDAQHAVNAVEADIASLEELTSFSQSQVVTDLNRGLLNVDSLTQLLEFRLEKRNALVASRFEKQKALKKVELAIKENNAELKSLAEKSIPTRYAAEVMLRVTDESPSFKISYRVGDCSWSPQYTVKSQSGSDEVTLSGQAQVVQNTGEDWEDVQLTLTASMEGQNAELLELTPLRVQSEGGIRGGADSGVGLGDLGGDGEMIGLGQENGLELNLFAAKQQLKELTEKSGRKQFSVGQNQPSPTGGVWELSNKASIPSGWDTNTLRVFTVTPSIETQFVLTPLLGSHAQRLAVFKTGCEKNLRNGPVRIYRDDQFIGSSSIVAKAAGQPFTLPMGNEYRLQTRRELLERTVQPKGGNQVITCKYRLVVSSVLDEAVDCQVLDRIPLAIDGNSAVVKLPDEVESDLSNDPLYQRMQRPYGVLRWDLEVPAQRFGSEAVDLEYTFTIEIQNGTQLISPNLADSVGQDLRFRQFNGGMGGMGGGGQF